MCEYTPDCKKSDDPLAPGLWARRKYATHLVVCGREKHPIAAVFNLPERGKVVVSPAFKMLRRSYLVDSRPGHELENPNGLFHAHASVIPVSDYAEGDSEDGRCRCGTWSYRPKAVEQRIFGHNDRGQPYSMGDYVSTADSEHSRRARERDETGN